LSCQRQSTPKVRAVRESTDAHLSQ
jgi:hypothetical protein